MTSLRCKKDMQRLNKRVTTFNRFISYSLNKCYIFFKIMKGKKDFEWIEECDKVFEKLKRYLGSPPLLVKPNHGDVMLSSYLLGTSSYFESHTIEVFTAYTFQAIIHKLDLTDKWNSGQPNLD